MSLQFQTDICTTGKLTGKCFLLEKQFRREGRFLARFVRAGRVGSLSQSPLCHWRETLRCAQGAGWNRAGVWNNLLQMHLKGEDLGFPVPVLLLFTLSFLTLLSKWFSDPFLTLHSLLSSGHTSSFSVPHQSESVHNWKLWVICSQWDAAVSTLLIPNGSSWGNQRSHLLLVALLVCPRTGPAALVSTTNKTQTVHRGTCWIHPSQKLHVPFSCLSSGSLLDS